MAHLILSICTCKKIGQQKYDPCMYCATEFISSKEMSVGCVRQTIYIARQENPMFRACYEQQGVNTVCCLFGLPVSGPLQTNIFISSGGILTFNASVICIHTEFNACDLVLVINIGLILLIKDKQQSIIHYNKFINVTTYEAGPGLQ